jgi:hypothetical protein
MRVKCHFFHREPHAYMQCLISLHTNAPLVKSRPLSIAAGCWVWLKRVQNARPHLWGGGVSKFLAVALDWLDAMLNTCAKRWITPT